MSKRLKMADPSELPGFQESSLPVSHISGLVEHNFKDPAFYKSLFTQCHSHAADLENVTLAEGYLYSVQRPVGGLTECAADFQTVGIFEGNNWCLSDNSPSTVDGLEFIELSDVESSYIVRIYDLKEEGSSDVVIIHCIKGDILQANKGEDESELKENRALGGIEMLTVVKKGLVSPVVEIRPSQSDLPWMDNPEIVYQGFKFKGRTSIFDIINFTSPAISSEFDGSKESMKSSIELVNVLKKEIRDGELSFRGKKVLELSSFRGLPGTLACNEGARSVHFHGLNAKVVKGKIIPNVLADLEHKRIWKDKLPCPKPVDVHFFAGDWESLPTVFSVDPEDDGYDIILLTDIPYSQTTVTKVFALVDQCLRVDGVLYLCAKKYHLLRGLVGAGYMQSLMEEKGSFQTRVLADRLDRETWKFFPKS